MKNTFRLIGIIALAVIVGSSMIACGGGGKIPNGKYVASFGWSYEFSGNKLKEFNSDNDLIDSGTWEISKEGIFIFNTDAGKTERHSFSRNGDTLTIGGTAYVKQ